MSTGLRAGTSNDGYLQVNGTDVLTALSSGDIGLGTSTPTCNLDITNSFFPEIRLNTGTVTTTVGVDTGSNIHVIGTTTDHGINIRSNNQTRIDITNDGLVGIGGSAETGKSLLVTSPNLDVVIENINTGQYNSGRLGLKGPAGTDRSTSLVHGNDNVGGTQTYFAIESKDSSDNYSHTIALYKYTDQLWTFNTGLNSTMSMKLDTGGVQVVESGGTSANLLQLRSNNNTRTTAIFENSGGSTTRVWEIGTRSDISASFPSSFYIYSVNDTNYSQVIHTEGQINYPNQPAFRASYGSTSITLSSAGRLPYTVNSQVGCFNQGNHYDNSSYTFTCPVAGNYFFTASTYTNLNQDAMWDIRLNGINVCRAEWRQSSGDDIGNNSIHQGSVIVKCAANDVIDVYWSAGEVELIGNYSVFCGHLLS